MSKLEITNPKKLITMLVEEKDRCSYDVVRCVCLSVFEPKKIYEELLAKVCFLAKKEVILELLIEDGGTDEHSWGKKGRWLHKGTPHQVVIATRLRIKRRLNDFGFVVKGIIPIKGYKHIVCAERMPEIKWDGTTPLGEYPEHTIVEVPLTFKDWRGFYARIDKEGQEWVKHKRVEQLLKEFKIYLFVPIYFCKDTDHVRQGAHRLEVARRRRDKTIKVRIMRVWWKKFESGKWIDSTPKGLPFLEDIKEGNGALEGEGT